MRGRRLPRIQLAPATALGRPWFLLSVAVLLTNDHLLKWAFPGTLTGKLSDFAGPAVVAGAASVLIGRSAAVALAALGFAALKTIPGVAEAAEPVLGGVTRRDPTDLIGLTVLPLVWHALGQERGPAVDVVRPASPTSATGWFRRRVLPVGGAALSAIALTATSPGRLTEVEALAASETAVFAELVDSDSSSDRDAEQSVWAVSTDGGLTWEELDGSPQADLTTSTEEACRSDGHCFAARGGTIEERVPGGDWQTVFRLKGSERDLLDYRRSSGGADPDEMFESVIVAHGPEGETVVVSARDQGVVVLDPRGRWQRVSVLDAEATPTNGSMVPLEAATVLLFASLPFALVLAAIRSFARGRGAGGWTVFGSTIGALLVAVGTWAIGIGTWALGTFTTQNPIILAAALGALACAVVLLPFEFVRRATPSPPPT